MKETNNKTDINLILKGNISSLIYLPLKSIAKFPTDFQQQLDQALNVAENEPKMPSI